MIKRISILLIFLFMAYLPVKAQYTESKERKRMWRKSLHRRKNRQAFNPYLDKKTKDKPSSVAAAEEKKGTRKMRRDYKRQQRRTMKKMGIKEVKVKKA